MVERQRVPKGAGAARVGVRQHGRVGAGSLLGRYDGLVCDLDGVIYTGDRPVRGSVATINRVLAAGNRIVFATNNASREPASVADHLLRLGVEVGGWSVVTSAQAAADALVRDLGSGRHVVAVGGPGVAAALKEVGLVAVRVEDIDERPVDAIVQGLGPDVTWRELTEIGLLARKGLPWVATNLDPVLPLDRGPAPGNGAMVAVVTAATGMSPRVVGKPEAGLYDLALKRLGTARFTTLVCGDRLDTDIAGARMAGLDSAVVLSGITRLRDVACAPPWQRPDYVAASLHDLGMSATALVSDSRARSPMGSKGLPQLQPDLDPQARLETFVMGAWDLLDAGEDLTSEEARWRDVERELL